jgi:hypothetical protein
MVTIQQTPQEIAAAQFRNAEMRIDALEKKEQAMRPNGFARVAGVAVGLGAGFGALKATSNVVGGFMTEQNVDGKLTEIARSASDAGFGKNGIAADFNQGINAVGNVLGKDTKLFKAENVRDVITKDYGSKIGAVAAKIADPIELQGTRVTKNLNTSVSKTFEKSKELRNAVSEGMAGNKFTQGIASSMSGAWKNAGPLGRNGARVAVLIGSVMAVGALTKHLLTDKQAMVTTAVQKEEAMQDRNQAAAYMQQLAEAQAQQQEGKWVNRVVASREAQSQGMARQ